MRRKRWRLRRAPMRYIYMLVGFLTAFALILTLFSKFRPVVSAFAESQAVWIATKVANQTVATVLAENEGVCRSMLTASYTDTNKLSSVVPDTAAINVVRTAITDAVMADLEQNSTLTVSIPTGTLAASEWLSGWGPLLSFPISYTATVLSDVSSSLEAVGMNQSTYRVLVHLDIQLYLVTPSGRSSVGTQLSYPMVEMVILGEVPDNLTEVYGDDQTLLGKIFDYGTTD